MAYEANDAKASFDDIYTRPDPRDYFTVLGSLDYSIPDLAKPIFRQIAAEWRARRMRSATILDLGSSFGVNAALYRYPLSIDMLRRRYARRQMLALPSDELRAMDKKFFESWPRETEDKIIVADVSRPAVDYALAAGLADAGVTSDLEKGASASDRRVLSEVDLVISTGCIGYVTEKTFAAILAATPRPPWVACFCLRMFDYRPISDLLARAGLVTEKLESAAFVQRRFRDEEEAAQVLSLLRERRINPEGLEADGLLTAELFVSRPPEDAAVTPLEKLVTITSGRNISFGPRYLELDKEGGAEIAAVRS